jgi:hypothetical protein
MRVVARIDEQNFFQEDVLLEDGAQLPEDCIEERPPEGFHAPKWSGSSEAWVEGKPTSEIFNDAKMAKEADLRNAAERWYRENVRAFEGAVVIHKIDRGQALSAEEQAIRDAMTANYQKLRTLVAQVRAATTLEEVEAVTWT